MAETDRLPPMPRPVEPTIHVGKIAFNRDYTGRLWLTRDAGEAMQLSIETEQQLEVKLREFFQENF
jgi:hypothetical protein